MPPARTTRENGVALSSAVEPTGLKYSMPSRSVWTIESDGLPPLPPSPSPLATNARLGAHPRWLAVRARRRVIISIARELRAAARGVSRRPESGRRFLLHGRLRADCMLVWLSAGLMSR